MGMNVPFFLVTWTISWSWKFEDNFYFATQTNDVEKKINLCVMKHTFYQIGGLQLIMN